MKATWTRGPSPTPARQLGWRGVQPCSRAFWLVTPRLRIGSRPAARGVAARRSLGGVLGQPVRGRCRLVVGDVVGPGRPAERLLGADRGVLDMEERGRRSRWPASGLAGPARPSGHRDRTRFPARRTGRSGARRSSGSSLTVCSMIALRPGDPVSTALARRRRGASLRRPAHLPARRRPRSSGHHSAKPGRLRGIDQIASALDPDPRERREIQASQIGQLVDHGARARGPDGLERLSRS